MAPNETAKLDEVLEQLSEHRSEFKVLCTELGVGGDVDKPRGRVPLLEKLVEGLDKRVRRLEVFFYMVAGGWALVTFVGKLAESAKNILEVLK
jgi:hypothetical protein